MSAGPDDRRWRAAVDSLHTATPFVRHLGIALLDAGRGWCETELRVLEVHRQQTGVAHAGVITALADHTAALAATTVLAAGLTLVSVEFKLNLLRPAAAEVLRCRGEVLKAGRRIVVCEADVLAEERGDRRLVSRLTATLMPVEGP